MEKFQRYRLDSVEKYKGNTSIKAMCLLSLSCWRIRKRRWAANCHLRSLLNSPDVGDTSPWSRCCPNTFLLNPTWNVYLQNSPHCKWVKSNEPHNYVSDTLGLVAYFSPLHTVYKHREQCKIGLRLWSWPSVSMYLMSLLDQVSDYHGIVEPSFSIKRPVSFSVSLVKVSNMAWTACVGVDAW